MAITMFFIFTIGIVVGMLNAVLVLLVTRKVKPTIDRKINQIQSAFALKGSIIEPENSELQAWIKEIEV